MFKEKLALILLASTAPAAGIGSAHAATPSRISSNAPIMEELIVYGTSASAKRQSGSELRARINANVEALNSKQKNELDAEFSRLTRPSIRIAATRLATRG